MDTVYKVTGELVQQGNPERPAVAAEGISWLPFGLVCLTYMAATVGEQVLSPLFPTTRGDLGLSKGQGGVAFAVLALAIAGCNLVSGSLLRHVTASTMLRWSMVTTVAGAVVAALAGGFAAIVVAQVLLGAGAGLFFPAGLQGVRAFGGSARRGFAMGIYGVAFSAGLTIAALLGTLGAAWSWRAAFWVTAALGAVALVAMLGMHTPPPDRTVSRGVPWRLVLGLPTLVGSVGAVLQYGVLAFFTTYAVDNWELTEGKAAGVLAVGRVLSIVAKLVGGRTTDRVGPRRSVFRTGLLLTGTGLAWVLLPAGPVTYAIAAVFAGTVSSIFPAANVMAVELFGNHGLALGAYRSVQIGLGALAGFLIGNSPLSLHTSMLIGVALSALLLWLCRPRPHDAVVAADAQGGQTPIAAP